MTDHDRLAQIDAAYVLGALEPGEATEFERHMVGCGECRARVDEARDTVAMLARAGADGAAVADEQLPDTLLPGLLRRASRERLRRRGVVAAGLAVAAACVVTLVVAFWPGGSTAPGGQEHLAARDFTPIADTPVRANASLISKDWGTQIDVHCSYAVGVRKTYRYTLRVVDDKGGVDSAGGWKVEPDHDVSYIGGTAVDLRDIALVQILAPDGTPVLELRN